MPEIKQDLRVATMIVAANNSLHRNDADYVCDGVADEVEINAALNALPAQGGRIMLLEGTFTIAHSIVIPGNSITMRGQGRSTFIDGDGLPTDEHGIRISAVTNCVIKKLAIQTQDGGGKTCHCIFIEDGADDFTIEHVTIVDSDSDGIHIAGTTILEGSINSCDIDGADDYGIYSGMDDGQPLQRLHVFDNFINACGAAGIALWGAGGFGVSQYCDISENVIFGNGNAGIYLWDSDYVIVGSNIVIGNNQYGIRLRGTEHGSLRGNICQINGMANIMLEESNDCTVDANMCQGSIDATADGIEIGGTDNDITANHCHGNGRNGIHVLGTGLRTTVMGNTSIESGDHGINVRAIECKISDNYCWDNGQDAAGTYHGINVEGTADRCQINNNYCGSPGDSQEDGIHLDDGATECQINNNYCYNGMGNGIELAGNNLDCQIVGNHCNQCDDYGILVADESDRCVVTSNKCFQNGEEGIRILESDYCTVTGNVCNDNSGDGIHVAGDATHEANYNTLTGNSCTGNTGDGIELSEVGAGNCNKTVVIGNQLLGNGAALTDGGTNTEQGHNITV